MTRKDFIKAVGAVGLFAVPSADAKMRPDPTRFPTVIEGKVESGKLIVKAHDVLHGTVAARYEFAARK
jgi:hypothetical protein